jgi:hypothetical protein
LLVGVDEVDGARVNTHDFGGFVGDQVKGGIQVTHGGDGAGNFAERGEANGGHEKIITVGNKCGA